MFDNGDSWAGFSLLGARRRQKDAFRVIENDGSVLLVACDGHGPAGDEAAVIACERLRAVYRHHRARGCDRTRAATEACAEVDRHIAQMCDGGTTAVLLELEMNALFIALVGDSSLRLTTALGRLQAVAAEHAVTDAVEARRLRSYGATIQNGMLVMGGRCIAIARSLGDPTFGDILLPVPECFHSSRLAVYRRLAVGTDGLWNTLDDAVVPSADILSWLEPTRSVLDNARRLAAETESREPSDNASSVVIDVTPFS
jgi:serine/threonine protein phosphatase PrpC